MPFHKLFRRHRGDTMVEVLVAFMLFLLLLAVVAGAMGYASRATRMAADARNLAYAADIALRDGSATPTVTGTATFTFTLPGGEPLHLAANTTETVLDLSQMPENSENAENPENPASPNAPLVFYRYAPLGNTP
ncbi:MAG: hypothetical protein PHO10_00140 [Gemmiger sp.]|nr:hypothetical protein [Gemmiger sp.]